MNLESIILSEISQREKDKFCMITWICGMYKIQQTGEYTKKEIDSTDAENKQVVISGERMGQHKGGGVEGTNYWV